MPPSLPVTAPTGFSPQRSGRGKRGLFHLPAAAFSGCAHASASAVSAKQASRPSGAKTARIGIEIRANRSVPGRGSNGRSTPPVIQSRVVRSVSTATSISVVPVSRSSPKSPRPLAFTSLELLICPAAETMRWNCQSHPGVSWRRFRISNQKNCLRLGARKRLAQLARWVSKGLMPGLPPAAPRRVSRGRFATG